MATATVDQGFGASITFQSGFFGSIESIEPFDVVREPIETTHMASTNGWATFLPSDIKKMGQMKITGQFDPSKTWKTAIAAVAENITITFPLPAGGTSAGTVQCSGFLAQFTPTVPMDDKMGYTAVIQFTGEPTFTAAA